MLNTANRKQGIGCLESTGSGTDDFKKAYNNCTFIILNSFKKVCNLFNVTLNYFLLTLSALFIMNL